MSDGVKIYALYLPQFHRIPENDEFWGEGFTDWTTVRNARSLFPGHNQPKKPFDNNYYDLSKKNNIIRQAKWAKDYGISGWGIYHYWFNNEKNLLTKPVEIILESPEIDIDFFFVWDNASWRRSWSNVPGNDWSPLYEGQSHNGPSVLIPYILGKESDWEKHFQWCLTFFKDSRYVYKDNKPVFVIYNYSKEVEEMCDYWDSLAKSAGLSGIMFIFRNANGVPSEYLRYNYEPLYSGIDRLSLSQRICAKLSRIFKCETIISFSYDEIWRKILRNAQRAETGIIKGAFVAYDDSPRRGRRGKMIVNGSPDKFRKYLKTLISVCKNCGDEMIFLTAWNEWGEGAYLEPDNISGFAYLEAVKSALEK